MILEISFTLGLYTTRPRIATAPAMPLWQRISTTGRLKRRKRKNSSMFTLQNIWYFLLRCPYIDPESNTPCGKTYATRSYPPALIHLYDCKYARGQKAVRDEYIKKHNLISLLKNRGLVQKLLTIFTLMRKFVSKITFDIFTCD